MRLGLILLFLALFASGTWGEDEDSVQELNLEGKWLAAYVPISYEEIVDISKQDNEYVVTKVRGDQ